MKLTLCVDKQERNNPSELIKKVNIEIGNRLCSYEDVYDELIITLNDTNKLEGIIKRRCNIDRFDIITKLEEEYIQTIEIPEVTLFEGTNYVYIEEFNDHYMKIDYLTNAEMNKQFAKSSEVKAQFIITTDQIKSYVSQTYQTKEGAQTQYTEIIQTTNSISQTVANNNTKANIIAKINDNTSQAKINADVVDIDANDVLNILAGNTINMTAKNIAFNSTNFNVDKDGKITATAGEIGGFELGISQFLANVSRQYNFTQADLTKIQQYLLGNITLTSEELELYDVDGNGVLNSADYLRIRFIINNQDGRYPNQTVSAKFILDTSDIKHSIKILDSLGKISTSIGLFSIATQTLNANTIYASGFQGNTLSIGNDKGYFGVSEMNNISEVSLTLEDKIYMHSYDGSIQCVSLTQTSKEEYKKNFEKLQNALDIIKNVDIYKYHMKEDKDTDKKHIGFVIGDKFNYSKEVTSKNNDGADIYALASVCCKAIQEQQEQINKLQERIKRLESDK